MEMFCYHHRHVSHEFVLCGKGLHCSTTTCGTFVHFATLSQSISFHFSFVLFLFFHLLFFSVASEWIKNSNFKAFQLLLSFANVDLMLLSLHKKAWMLILIMIIVSVVISSLLLLLLLLLLSLSNSSSFFHMSQSNCITNTIKMNCGVNEAGRERENAREKCGHKREKRNKLQ